MLHKYLLNEWMDELKVYIFFLQSSFIMLALMTNYGTWPFVLLSCIAIFFIIFILSTMDILTQNKKLFITKYIVDIILNL